MDTSPVGIFDSGVGGLSVFSELARAVPNRHYIYFGDSKNLPYGTKSQDEIIAFGKNIVRFFISKGVEDVVIACNTSSALSYEALLSEFGPKVKIHPLIQTVAKDLAKYSSVGVLATQGTANSLKYTQEIIKNNPKARVAEVGCTGFVEIVENRLYEDIKSIELVKNKVVPLLEEGVEKIVLGCTHYPYLMPILEKFAPSDMFIDPAVLFCRRIEEEFSRNELKSENRPKREFYVSASPEKFVESAKVFYDVEKAVLV
ncbi:glutamate racemase [Candidatus Gastranaerophilus sp. (ex Termes propinquus)]|nr:glutamate racemase [Candidatus Gastranaerophilus sp. (ex Termes propinquus)]